MTPSEREAALARVTELAKAFKMNRSTLRYRLQTGWNLRDALETPPDPDQSRKARSLHEWLKRNP